MSPHLTARHWIGGEWVDSTTRLPSYDPATGDTIGSYADGGEIEARKAVSAARAAFQSSPWRGDRRLRARAINEMADRFEARAEELIEVLCLENGKIEPEARFEVTMVPSKLRFYASLALTDFGRAIETSPGKYSMTLREPMGVAGIIAPWNSPVVLFIRSLAPALAAGCTVVGKLPGLTAQTNAKMCEVFAEVKSLPKGRNQRLLGVPRCRGAGHRCLPRCSDDQPDGKLQNGQAILAEGAPTLKRFGGELGGKTPVLLFQDCDLSKALPKVEKALTTFAGQFCMTGSRLLVHRSILDTVRQRLGAQLERVKVGRPRTRPATWGLS